MHPADLYLPLKTATVAVPDSDFSKHCPRFVIVLWWQLFGLLSTECTEHDVEAI